jgi:hypothetical protein
LPRKPNATGALMTRKRSSANGERKSLELYRTRSRIGLLLKADLNFHAIAPVAAMKRPGHEAPPIKPYAHFPHQWTNVGHRHAKSHREHSRLH